MRPRKGIRGMEVPVDRALSDKFTLSLTQPVTRQFSEQ
jgi:hypothetical protein